MTEATVRPLAADLAAYQVRSATPADARQVHSLLAANGWQHRVKSVEWLAELIARSQRTAVAVAPEAQVLGFLRAITDELSNGYLSMLVVAEAHRRRGIGTALVHTVTAGLPEVTWVLQAGRAGAESFFASLGFAHAPLAMQLARRQSVI